MVMNSKIRILASPGTDLRNRNPYTRLLYSPMHARVDEYSFWRALLHQYDILHLHWPEGPLNYSRLGILAIWRLARQLLVIDLMRLRGSKVFWTVHNLHAHDRSSPHIEKWFWNALTKRLDGYIVLSESGKNAAQKSFPALRDIPGFIVPHGNYRGTYLSNGFDLRRVFGMQSEARVMLFFGRVCSYKNVPWLIKEFRALAEPDVKLIVAGNPSCAQIVPEIIDACGGDQRIRLDLGHICDKKVSAYFKAADLVVLPYTDILNSGTALLSLSLDRPVLVPNRGAMKDLAAEVGAGWVHCYEGDLTATELFEALNWARLGDRSASAPVDHLAWPLIAKQTLEAYRIVLAGMSRVGSSARLHKPGLENHCQEIQR